MLQNTFIHIQSIGAITEQRLWESGLRDWDAFSDDISMPLSGKRKYLLQKGIEESRQNLYHDNPGYFSKLLPANQSWRFFPEFRNSTVYLDIETTGLDRYYQSITTIALYNGHEIKTYVQGQNLDDFIEDIKRYKVIVSYNGKSFDVPFIEHQFKIRLKQAHIDLRYVLYSLGFKGGLKGCERQLGMDRGDLSDIDGFFAVLLWEEYQRSGDQKALDTLLAYNIQDTVTLENLMVTAYNMKLKDTPFYETHLIEKPTLSVNPIRADLATIDRIKSSSVSVSMLEMWLKRKFESTVMASTSQLVWKVYLKQEARIISGLSNDAAAIDLFKSGKDIYLGTTKTIIGGALETSRLRALGKEIVLGLNNGRSAYSIYDGLARMGFGYDLDSVQRMIFQYEMAFEGIKTWRENIASTSLKEGFVSTELGRRLKVSRDVNVNSLYNYPVQGTAADGFKLALINMDEQLTEHDARIVHILHDEVIVETRGDIAGSVMVIVKGCMEMAFREILPEVPFVVEPEIRESWG